MGGKVLVNQVGWAGINLGRIDYYFTKGKKEDELPIRKCFLFGNKINIKHPKKIVVMQ